MRSNATSAAGGGLLGALPAFTHAPASTNCLWEADEQVAQVGGVRRVAQQGGHAEYLLDRPQRRAVGVGDGVLVPPTLGLRREHDHADRPVAGDGLVPED